MGTPSAAALASARVIDLHAHVVLAETMGAAGRFGPELGADPDGKPWFRIGEYRLLGVKYRGSPFMDPALRIAAMDRAGIDFQVLSPNPLTYFHFIDAPEAIAFCRRHNDALAALVESRKERLGGLAALPMQDPAAAVAELRRAVEELELLGAAFGTDLPLPIDDPKFDALYEAAVALDVPLFIHPGPAGIDGPPGDPRLKRFDLDIMTGFAGQETIAVATLIFGGVLDRHPGLDIWVSHGGGAAGYLHDRLALGSRKRPWSPAHLRVEGAFEARLQRLWLDTHLHDARAVEFLISKVGTQRLTYGTNFAGWDQPDAAETAHVPAYLADNARRLLRAAPRKGS